MKKKLTAVVCFNIILSCFAQYVSADPYSHCQQILENGAFDINAIQINKAKKGYAHSWMCNQTYSDSGSSSGAKIKGAFEAINGAGSYNQSKFNSYKSNYCVTDMSGYSAVEKSHVYSQVASSSIVDAWKACIGDNNRGLVCSAEQINDTDVIFKVSMKYGPDGGLKNARMNLSNFIEIFNHSINSDLNQGNDDIFNLKKQNNANDGVIQVRGTTYTTNRTTYCNYRIPRPIAPPDFERMKIQSLISSDKYDQGNHFRNFYPSAGCHVKIHERLRVVSSTISLNKSSINVAYTCHRPDHSYRCGGRWTQPVDATYSGHVTASSSINAGTLSISNVVNADDNPERSCGNIISEYLKSLNGTSLF